RRLRRVVPEPVGHLVVGEEDRDRLIARQPRLLGSARRRRQQQCRENDDRGRSQRRNDQSLFPMKFSGVTSTIAIAWATILPTPTTSTRAVSRSRLAPYARTATVRNRSP